MPEFCPFSPYRLSLKGPTKGTGGKKKEKAILYQQTAQGVPWRRAALRGWAVGQFQDSSLRVSATAERPDGAGAVWARTPNQQNKVPFQKIQHLDETTGSIIQIEQGMGNKAKGK